MPSFCSWQPRSPVSGTTPSLMMTRIWGSGNEAHSKTGDRGCKRLRFIKRKEEKKRNDYTRWNWILVANGVSSASLNDRWWGTWVKGKGPDSAKDVKFSAVITSKKQRNKQHVMKDKKKTLTAQKNCIVRGVNIEALIKRESDRIIIEGCISWRIVNLNGRMSKTSNEFLDIPNALRAGSRWAKSKHIPTVNCQQRASTILLWHSSHTKIVNHNWTVLWVAASRRV